MADNGMTIDGLLAGRTEPILLLNGWLHQTRMLCRMNCTYWIFGFNWLRHIDGPGHLIYLNTTALIGTGSIERLLSFGGITCLQKVKKVQPVQFSISDLNGHGAAQCFEKDLIQTCIDDSSK